jgi:hypothetical protein
MPQLGQELDNLKVEYGQTKENLFETNNYLQTKNLHLYYGEPSHVARECPKKHGPHAAHAISVTNPQLKESKNEHVQS